MASPQQLKDVEDEPLCDLIHKKGCAGFHCVGDSIKRTHFDRQGFLHCTAQDAFVTYNDGQCLGQTFATVFEQSQDIDIFSREDFDRLFRIARHRLSAIETAVKPHAGYHDSTSVEKLNTIRQELREFFIFLRVFVLIQGNQPESYWIIKETLSSVVGGLSLLRTQLGWLTDLSSNIWNQIHNKSSSKPSAQAAFHLFHCHLELRWLNISVLESLAQWDLTSKSHESSLSGASQSYASNIDLQAILLEAIQLCVVDLIDVAVSRFNKLAMDEVVHSSMYNCMCVKELWLLLRLAFERSSSVGVKSFWNVIDALLELLVLDNTSSKQKARALKVPSKLYCYDPCLCSLWLLQNIAELFSYRSDGFFMNPKVYELESNYSGLKRVLSKLSDPSVSVNESQRRLSVMLVKVLVTELWRPKPEPIMMLWESFYRNLDCAFQSPCSSITAYITPSETVLDILNPLLETSAGKSGRNFNSYELFLSLLGTFLNHDPSQWRLKMQGRFYSKLSVRKVNSLSEMGIYHLTQLFLTIALQTDVLELGQQFEKFVNFTENDDKRSCMVMKAYLCFIYISAKNEQPLDPLTDPVLKMANYFSRKRNSDVAKVLVDNLEHIVNSSGAVLLNLHVLVGEWVKLYLEHQDTKRSLLNLMLTIMNKVLSHVESNFVGEVEKLVSCLQEYLLPYVKDNVCISTPQIADLAVHFTLLSLDFNSQCGKPDSFQSLLTYFITNDSSNIMFVKRYLYSILSNHKMKGIIQRHEVQILFIQAWIRCCLFAENGTRDIDQDKCVLEKILPHLQNFAQLSSVLMQGLQSSADPLVHLLKILGNSPATSKSIMDVFLGPMRQLLPVLRSTLGLVKQKDGSRKLELSKEIVIRAFFVFGKLTCDCAPIIYDKGSSSSFLLSVMTTLIIPPPVFGIEFILPMAMAEGLRKSLPFYLQGLNKLDPVKEKCIQRFFNDIIRCYVPRFRAQPSCDPFVRIWDEPENMPTAIQILKSVCDTLLQLDKRTALPHPQYIQGLQLIRDIVKRNACDDVLQTFLVSNAFPNMLEVSVRGNDLNASNRRRETEKTLEVIFKAENNRTYENLWIDALTALNKLSDKYLSFNSDIFMQMLHFLVKDYKDLLNKFLPSLEANMKNVISKRGSGSDKSLESKFRKLKGALNEPSSSH